MKFVSKLIATSAAAGYLAMSGVAQAQIDQLPSEGELPENVVACFFECKDGYQDTWWQEVTTLMLMNPANTDPTLNITRLFFLDGQQNFIADMSVESNSFDLDEVNICRSLEAGAAPVPSAGMILAIPGAAATDYVDYIWIKNLVGKFFKTVDEPFDGRVTGVAKTECRVVPRPVVLDTAIQDAFNATNPIPPTVDPILIEDTAD
jgi:hypothetical protein